MAHDITPRATRNRVGEEQCKEEARRGEALASACLLLSGNLAVGGPLDLPQVAMEVAAQFVIYLQCGKIMTYRETQAWQMLADIEEKGDSGT